MDVVEPRHQRFNAARALGEYSVHMHRAQIKDRGDCRVIHAFYEAKRVVQRRQEVGAVGGGIGLDRNLRPRSGSAVAKPHEDFGRLDPKLAPLPSLPERRAVWVSRTRGWEC
jgi:hypothetical protein